MQAESTQGTYKVWASDDMVYGPVTEQTLRDWVRDERVLASTWIHCPSDHSWQRAGDIPALREALLEVQSSLSQPTDSAGKPEAISLDELRQFAQLANLPSAQLEQVRRFGELRVALPGARVIKKGEPGDALYLVLSGEVRVRLLLGMEDKTLFTIRPGRFFGEMALFNHAPRSADVVAATESRLMRVTQQAFLLFIKEIPELAGPILYTLASTLADRLLASNQRFQQDATADFLWR